MWYVKNVPSWERVARLVVGLAMLTYGVVKLNVVPLGWLVAVSGVLFALTGTVGFCPMCAMVGRKIAAKGDRTLP
jgi:hypothetical protein